MAIRELDGLYNVGSNYIWKIKFPYKRNATYIFAGTKADAKQAAEKLRTSMNYMYEPSITTVTKALS